MRIYGQVIGIKFGIEKCAMLIMRTGNNSWRKESNYQPRKDQNSWRKLKAETVKQVEIKEKIKKESLRRTRKRLETKLYSKNLIKVDVRRKTNGPENKKINDNA